MKKNKKLSIRISSENLETIKQKAEEAKLSQSEYVISCCLGQKIIIFDGLKELISELRYIGNHLNRLVILANLERIEVIYLNEILDKFKEISRRLKHILEKGESKWR
ncbi:MAG: plasmid mobilization relaxosome protein MobC [Clostridia bacterium]